jgi:alkanesulfonate monooxygenase SsuD/methylene tetrahydromethanopterin reductase-like flavin-dependent oxidoreductase (luciferase family)
MSFHCYVAETHEAAIAGFKRPVERYVEVFSEAIASWDGRTSGNYAGYEKMVAAVRAQTPDTLREGRVAFVGTPAEVIEQVQFVRDTFGEVEPSMQINFGSISTDEALRTLELFAREVMPAFPDGSGAGATGPAAPAPVTR